MNSLQGERILCRFEHILDTGSYLLEPVLLLQLSEQSPAEGAVSADQVRCIGPAEDGRRTVQYSEESLYREVLFWKYHRYDAEPEDTLDVIPLRAVPLATDHHIPDPDCPPAL